MKQAILVLVLAVCLLAVGVHGLVPLLREHENKSLETRCDSLTALSDSLRELLTFQQKRCDILVTGYEKENAELRDQAEYLGLIMRTVRMPAEVESVWTPVRIWVDGKLVRCDTIYIPERELP